MCPVRLTHNLKCLPFLNIYITIPTTIIYTIWHSQAKSINISSKNKEIPLEISEIKKPSVI